jgi:predicted ATPase/class 3 adenylate cyclase
MQLNLLGPVELLDDAGAPVALGGPTQRAVLATLALAKGRAVSVDALLSAAWPGEGPPSGAKAVQSVISRLRTSLKAAGGGGALDNEGNGYALRLPAGALDVDRVDALSPHDALALWRGPALEEFAGLPSFVPDRRRLAELRWRLIEDNGEAELAAGHHTALIADLEVHLGAEPLRPRLWQQFLTALSRAGRQADALRAFQRCRDAFADAGLDPPAELVALEKAIASGDAPLEGDVTFLFTDVVGSTKMWEEKAADMAAALAVHDATVEAAVGGRGGRVLKTKGEGDSTVSVFRSASDALLAAADAQRALELPVRMAVHTGPVEARGGDYFGPTLNRAARLRATAHAGQIVCSEVVAALAGLPADHELIDLGIHRLRDLARPERVFQLAGPELATDFPPLASLTRRDTNLPAQTTSFVGRDAELERVAELLAASRLVTLTGAGGSGKTRLALQAAAESLDQFPGGVWLAELAPIEDPARVVDAAAGALGITVFPGTDTVGQVVAGLGERGALLVLDNCEHVIDAAAELAAAILAGCPNAKVLATSRERLRVAGETSWPVPVMQLPTAASDAADSEAVRLFCDRAVRADPRFELDGGNADAVVEICRRVDGIPLAIELAAARVRMLPPNELARRLAEHRDVLAGGDRTALPRHRSLRATIDWSYALLSDAEQTVLRRLSVFRGGCTLASAERVAGDAPEVLDALEGLVDKSLLFIDEHDGRYHVLETVREFALERLAEADERHEWDRRHAREMVEVACGIFRQMTQADDQPGAVARSRVENDNFVAAMAWAFDNDHETAGELVGYLLTAWYAAQRVDTLPWLYRTTEIADELSDVVAARALVGAGVFLGYAGERELGIGLAQRGIAAARAAGMATELVGGLAFLGALYRIYDQHELGLPLIEEALTIALPPDEVFALANMYVRASWVLGDNGEVDRAVELANRGYRLAVERHEYTAQVTVLDAGWIPLSAFESDEERFAESDRVKALMLEEPTGDDVAWLGYQALQSGDFETAIAHFEDALSRPQGHWRFTLGYKLSLADALVALGRAEDAGKVIGPMLDDPDLNDLDRGRLLTSYVPILRDTGDPATARAVLDELIADVLAGNVPEQGWAGVDNRLLLGWLLAFAATLLIGDPEKTAADAARMIAVADAAIAAIPWGPAEAGRILALAPTLPPPPPEAAEVGRTAPLADVVAYALGTGWASDAK